MTEERCRNCDKYYIKLHSRHYFCSTECKRIYNYDNQSFEIICDQCGKTFSRKTKKRRGEFSCCSPECVSEYKKEKYNETRKCEICDKDFYCKKISPKKYCSLKCQIEWQRKNPRTGEKHPSYMKELPLEYRIKKCEWCGKDFSISPYQKDTAKFCSKKCRQTWYSEVYSQSDEWRQRKSISAAKQMKNNRKKSLSKTQIKINNLLSEMGIEYENEVVFGNFSVDNFLRKENLVIEVMGRFWHCDSRRYLNIKYENQKTRITMDKIKNKIITENYNTPILYLWEDDITENFYFCKKLIEKFIKEKREMINFNSSDYLLSDDGEIYLNPDRIKQYLYYDAEEIRKVVIPELSGRISRKELDKWILFNCEFCGKEKEQLISHYKKSKTHFCSGKCSSESRKIGTSVT